MPIVVERAGSRVELSVTPHDGRLGLAPVFESEKVSLGIALVQGSRLPFTVVRETAAGFMHIASGRDKADFRKQSNVASETGAAEREGSALPFLAMLAAYLWPFLAGIPFFDAAVSHVFHAVHPQVEQSALRGYRLERLRLTLWLALSGFVTVSVAAGLATVGLPAAVVLLLWAMPAAAATYPLIWIAGNEVWNPSVVILALGVSLFAPCVALLIIFALLRQLHVALRSEGFRTGWFRADPA